MNIETWLRARPGLGGKLLLMVGLPYSGKTTLARDLEELAVRICADDVRLALHGQRFYAQAEPHVWAIMETFARALLLGGQNAIVDVTNNTFNRRRPWYRLADETSPVGLCYVDTPYGISRHRAEEAHDREIYLTMDRMFKEHEPPLTDPEKTFLEYYLPSGTAIPIWRGGSLEELNYEPWRHQ